LHRQYMLHILKDIFTDPSTGACLAFKGGTSLMFLYGLKRFSVDLDFNLLDLSKERTVFEKIKQATAKYGTLSDAQDKFFGPVIVLDYGRGERKLKIEISNREYGSSYEIKSAYGIDMRVMKVEDMFAHKLCALTDRNGVTGRDIFDIWHFLQGKFSVNKGIVESRTGTSMDDYLTRCINLISQANEKRIMQDIGELLSPEMKGFVRNSLRDEVIQLLEFFKSYPLISINSPQPMTIENAVISIHNDGQSYVSAKVSGFECLSKRITKEEQAFYRDLPEGDEKRKCATNLARKYYADWWRGTSLKKKCKQSY